MVKKIGIPPKGSTMGNSAKYVAAAEAGNVRKKCPSACADVMPSSELEWIDNLYTQVLEILFIPGGYCQPVQPCGRRDHGVV
jgi:hypothetical protein